MLKAPAAVSFAQPLIARGTELRNVEPIVAYFCFYSAVQQVLDAKLHTTNTEVSDFATYLLNELEEMKSSGLQNEDSKSILESDDASRAYVLDFAANVFTKVQAAVDQLSVTKATGVGFIAASTFLALEQVWGPLAPETSDKIKYAKYQAARILGAIKRGEDPNEQFRLEAEQAQLAEQPEPEGELSGNGDAASETIDNAAAGKPDAVEKSEEIETREIDIVQRNTEKGDTENTHFGDNALSRAYAEPKQSTEDSEYTNNGEFELPAAPHDDPSDDLELPGPPKEDLNDDLTLPGAPHNKPEGNVSPPQPPPKQNSANKHTEPKAKKPAETTVKPISQAAAVPEKQRLNPSEIVELTKITSKAQKHAKYAISALNYEDIKTAIGELESALNTLKVYESENA